MCSHEIRYAIAEFTLYIEDEARADRRAVALPKGTLVWQVRRAKICSYKGLKAWNVQRHTKQRL
jgi:hypothetical protein